MEIWVLLIITVTLETFSKIFQVKGREHSDKDINCHDRASFVVCRNSEVGSEGSRTFAFPQSLMTVKKYLN